MLRRLKCWLRRWLRYILEDETTSIDCYISGKIQRMAIIGVEGLHLQVYDGQQMRLISEQQAVNPKLFWEAWKARAPRLVWEDGTPFEPPA